MDAGYLQRFGIAPANESYIISILRFLGLIDDEGDRRDENADFFYGGDEVFKPGLEQRVRAAYAQVFDEMGEGALTAEKDVLTNWFRASDKTSALVGQRQANTFQTLVALAGHGEVPATRASRAKGPPPSTAARKQATEKPSSPAVADEAASPTRRPADQRDSAITRPADVGLAVRIEVNLPPGEDAATYDAIFASIKKHLMA